MKEKVWYSPIRAYSDYLLLAEEIGTVEIEQDRKYKKVYETRLLAVLCLALSNFQKIPYFLQLCKNDPPDGLIMRMSPTQKGVIEVMQVEISSYLKRNGKLPTDSLLDQLKRTKAVQGHHKYTNKDTILIEIGLHYKGDFNEIHKYLSSINAPYTVWFIQEVVNKPDTIAELTICDVSASEVVQKRLNLGRAWANYKKLMPPFWLPNSGDATPAFIYLERVGNANKVRMERNDRAYGLPWEFK